MKKAFSQIRVLHILPSLKKCGGMESFVMNYYREIYKEVSFSFAVFGDVEKEYIDEAKSLGGDVKHFGHFSLKSVKELKRQFSKFLSENNFDIVHCHMANAAFALLPVAKKNGIKVRIIHSHQNKYSDKLLHSIRNYPLVKIGLREATDFFACSKEAGDFLFGKRKYQSIKNAIVPEYYSFDHIKREKIRKKFNIKDSDFLIGHTGRFVPQKNHAFIINVFKDYHQENPNAKLMFVGDGPLEEPIKQSVLENQLNNSVYFAGSVKITGEYLSAFDAFIFPSRYEGLGISCVEAQCSGLPVLASNNVPNESRVIDELINYYDLNKNNEWVKSLSQISKAPMADRKQYFKAFEKSDYNIHVSAEKLVNAYRLCLLEVDN